VTNPDRSFNLINVTLRVTAPSTMDDEAATFLTEELETFLEVQLNVLGTTIADAHPGVKLVVS
jgi:hypothetical protein